MKIKNNIEESYCSFEVSKLLKEKGFGVATSTYYKEPGKLITSFKDSGCSEEEYYFDVTDFYENWNDGAVINKDGNRCYGCSHNIGYVDTYSAPTHAIAIQWLQVNFGIWISIELVDNTRIFNYFPCITTMKDREYNDEDMIDQAKYYYLTELGAKTSQEATEAALLYALTKLI